MTSRTGDGLALQLVDIAKSFGSVKALAGLSLDVAQGEMIALLGPSGCGKTTALRAVAGLQDLDRGEILLQGRDITNLSASKRGMGMVFQAYSLFPHMTARQNVEYGLRLRAHRMDRTARKQRSMELLELVGLSTHAGHYPHQLSGGQQQRVALARALAISPKVLLLDEPLSALDAKVRTQLRDEIRRIQLELGTTTLFVTHDQEEALGIADRIGVMSQGVLEQIGSPTELYTAPRTGFVAEFVGLSNKVSCTVTDGTARVFESTVPVLAGSVTGEATALVRPENVSLVVDQTANHRVIATGFLGAIARVQVRAANGDRIIAQMPSELAATLTPGTAVTIAVKPNPVFARAR